MSDDDSVTIGSSDSRSSSPDAADRPEPTLYDILSARITNTISALGAPSPTDPSLYVLGDDVLGCLRDLKRFWRRDDNDEERTIARIFAKANLLEKDLVPILCATAGTMPKVAVACADLITSMTWPLDLAAELRELDEAGITGIATDYPLLTRALLSYKAALTRSPTAVQALVHIALPSLALSPSSRAERDKQIVNVVLHCVRNILAIRDLKGDVNKSGDWGELATLQSSLIRRLKQSGFMDLLATLTSNADGPVANSYSSILLEIWYLLYRGVPAARLVIPPQQRPKGELRSLLSTEEAMRRVHSTSSRHSRFGTSITLKTANGKEKYVLHRQQGITGLPSETIDQNKKGLAKKTKMVDDLGAEQSLSHDALNVLRDLAVVFLDSCFNIFFASLLKDIRLERPHVTEADNVRLLVVSSWFVEFFLAARARADTEEGPDNETPEEEKVWTVSKVAECCEQEWIVWVVRRMRGAGEEKPKAWIELQASMEALTQLLLLIECMSSSPSEDVRDAALALQHKLWFSSELMDVALEGAKSYHGQSLAYLDGVVQLNYVLLKLLEKYAKGRSAMYVRKRTKAKRKKGKSGNEDDDGDEEEEPEDSGPTYEQRKFEFEAFELRFANEEITSTLLAYLSRYRELSAEGTLGSDKIKRIVSLIHRQVVKAKAEGLYFKVTTLELFRHILDDEKTLPADASHKEMFLLVRYTLRQFFKEVEKGPFLLVEAFFPKNRGRWKEFSTYEPPKKEKRVRLSKEDESEDDRPIEVVVKGEYSWSEQLGIAMACLIDDGKRNLVDWIRELLVLVVAERQAIVAMTDPPEEINLDEEMDDDEIRQRNKGPSAEAISKFLDFAVKYDNDGQSEAATKNTHLKLMLRLVKFFPVNEESKPLEWYCPAGILPSELESSIRIIDQFIENPLDLDGKSAASLLKKKARRRRRRALSDTEAELLSEGEEPRKRKAKRKKEQQQYKSAQFIEDSDVDADAEEEFFKKEAELRARMERNAALGGHAMQAKGTKTKKRKSQAGADGSRKKRRKTAEKDQASQERVPTPPMDADADSSANESQPASSLFRAGTPASTPPTAASSSSRNDADDMEVVDPAPQITKPAPRPRPRPRMLKSAPNVPDSEAKSVATSPPSRPVEDDTVMSESDEEAPAAVSQKRTAKRRVVVADDSDDE